MHTIFASRKFNEKFIKKTTKMENITNQQIYADHQVTKENSAQLRKESMQMALAATGSDLATRIKKALLKAWGEWVPDYEGWLRWSSGLYTPDSLIYAIGDKPQRFADYQASMRHQREAATMEMGPIMQIAVEGYTAALVYHMYLCPKAQPEKCFDIMVTEFNTFEETDGQLMVKRLDLYTTKIM